MQTPQKNNCSEYRTPSKSKRLSAVRSRTPSLKALENCIVDPQHSPESELKTPRKSSRKATPNNRYANEFYEKRQSAKKSPWKRLQTNSSSESESHDNCSDNLKTETMVDHAELFTEIDVDGKRIYGFNTPKRSDGMLKMALNTPKTPKSFNQQTPERKRKKPNDIHTKTPRLLRTKLKKEITKHIREETASDFSAESDFEINSSSEEESSESSDSETDHDDCQKSENTRNTILTKATAKNPTWNNPSGVRRSKRLADEFVPKSDAYFNTYSNKKVVTSDHTLDRLKNPRLPADSLFSLLSDMKLSTEHEQSVADIFEEHKANFTKWLYILNEGFNILLYGLGSKRNLLQSFHREMLENQTVLVINGFFPSLTIKNILDGILLDILELSSIPANLHEAVGVLEEEMMIIPEVHIFLIIHNIDGPMLRNYKAQELLSRLAKISNIHLLATIDHINTPLLWDHTKLSNYNFSWWDTTTMLPYTAETAFENSMLVQNSGELALSSMRNVFLSLTTNARGIYMIIVKYQLKNKENQNFQGMPIKDLYWGSRDAFLVSSDIALRAQLTEFLDHKLVKSKRNVDGSESLQIPIESALLEQFLEEQEQ